MNKTYNTNYKTKLKKVFLGTQEDDGLIYKIFVYILLVGIGFIYLYPMLYMLSYSFQDIEDLLNPMVNWIPTHLHLGNYTRAIKVLDYGPTLLTTIGVVLISTCAQIVSSALIGYGFARFEFPGRRVFFTLMLMTFIIPPQVHMIPRFLMYKRLGLLKSILSFVIPALSGQGIHHALFILLFFQFFRMMPKALEEAAQIDGAGDFRIFIKIALPTAVPAFIVSFVLSFVWYWNETYMASLYFGGEITTLPLKLSRFVEAYRKVFPAGSGSIDQVNESIRMAGTLLTIVPLLIVYFILQRWFIQGIDSTGITGE